MAAHLVKQMKISLKTCYTFSCFHEDIIFISFILKNLIYTSALLTFDTLHENQHFAPENRLDLKRKFIHLPSISFQRVCCQFLGGFSSNFTKHHQTFQIYKLYGYPIGSMGLPAILTYLHEKHRNQSTNQRNPWGSVKNSEPFVTPWILWSVRRIGKPHS